MALIDVIVLAAGRGTRLGTGTPKALTPLRDETLVTRQLRLLAPLRDAGARFSVVVGHRAGELARALCEHHVDLVDNPAYATTGTARSLLAGLSSTHALSDALWLNADVVFDPGFAHSVVDRVLSGRGSFIGVRRGVTGEEEVKYRLDAQGRISELSKEVRHGTGEAIGVNFVTGADRAAFARALGRAEPTDYFERGVELSLELGWSAHDLTDHFAVEVDFPADLDIARVYAATEGSYGVAQAVGA